MPSYLPVIHRATVGAMARPLLAGLLCPVSPVAQSVAPGEPAQRPCLASFQDIAEATGLDFVHTSGRTGKYLFPEITSSGCALLDYDDDGDLDAYLLQGKLLTPDATSGSTSSRDPPKPVTNRLFRNELSGGKGLCFTDVTEASRSGDEGYAQGVATGDYDNDGDVDLYVTNLGPDVLLRNEDKGTFANATASAGLGDPRWTTSASFFDFDLDGFLDLYVAAYADYSVAGNKECTRGSRLDYCGPHAYPPLPPRFYRNKDGKEFADITSETGVDRAYGHGLGVVAADFDANGWLDVYVANDGDPNLLWLNEAGVFKNAGLASGCAVNYVGRAQAGMGIALDDFDEDGDPDILVTNLTGEPNSLFQNLGNGLFADRTARYRLGTCSVPFTGWGVAWLDVDHDADLDLLIANGAAYAIEALAGDPFPYHQTNQLMIQESDGTFSDRSDQAGPALQLSEVSRGLAVGDVDNDGDVDALISNLDGRARLLRNDLANKQKWLILRVIDEATHRDAFGAGVRLTLSSGRVLHRSVRTDGSYCSASDARVHFAWPATLAIERLEIALPRQPVTKVDPPDACTIATVRVSSKPSER